MKYAVVTFGCRVNQAESLAIEDRLRACGATAVSPDEADVVVVNTCSVTASADQAARQTVRRIARANPAVRVVVTGCYATRQPGEVSALPNVVRVVENAGKDDLIDAVAGDIGLTTARRFGDGDGPCGHTLTPGVAGRTALTLRVQTGCEEACSYCIIPSTRGMSRSRPLAGVVRDVQRAVAAGYKEIAITGVHLGSYGRDLDDGSSLATLIRTLGGWQDAVLFRISSLEPMDCTPEIVDEVASSGRLAPHFHLPLQHGSDAMLRAMRRPYTVSYYRSLIDRIKTALPHASVGSDIIVGFPGESAAHFNEMRMVLEGLPLTHLHVFPYSDRPGTDASKMFPKVDGREVRERGRDVRAIGERMARRFRESQAGRTLRALTVDDGQSVVTDNYLKLRLDVRQPRNEWVRVRVEGDQQATVVGDLNADFRLGRLQTAVE
ncbi:MAG: tRNA ((6)-L-threonylcarbamoyladenosine(37)-C(2))-methylthiotransferase MtaB [Acidobacteria bacterium]|nr:tRNA ((6)-L-threonylcarbamoyladenosine(37)-C(2))-methylthiotransferase MtaB [Acidobacteriota bacterium]